MFCKFWLLCLINMYPKNITLNDLNFSRPLWVTNLSLQTFNKRCSKGWWKKKERHGLMRMQRHLYILSCIISREIDIILISRNLLSSCTVLHKPLNKYDKCHLTEVLMSFTVVCILINAIISFLRIHSSKEWIKF